MTVDEQIKRVGKGGSQVNMQKVAVVHLEQYHGRMEGHDEGHDDAYSGGEYVDVHRTSWLVENP
jgi:hypothetical protein